MLPYPGALCSPNAATPTGLHIGALVMMITCDAGMIDHDRHDWMSLVLAPPSPPTPRPAPEGTTQGRSFVLCFKDGLRVVA